MGLDKVQIVKRKPLIGRAQYSARVVAHNGRILFRSSESYNNEHDLLEIVDRLFPGLRREWIYPRR